MKAIKSIKTLKQRYPDYVIGYASEWGLEAVGRYAYSYVGGVRYYPPTRAYESLASVASAIAEDERVRVARLSGFCDS